MGESAHLEIIENCSLGFCVGYYEGGKFKLVILEKPIFYFCYIIVKDEHIVGKKWLEMVVKRPFISQF